MSRLILDHQTIESLLLQAGEEILLPGLQQQQHAVTKSDGSVVTSIDLACQEFLKHALQEIAPDIAFLGEEMSHHEQQNLIDGNQPFWCVDPLDGTSNFTIPMPFFAISLALMEKGEPVFAVIHDPVRQETFSAIKGQGCQLNQQAVQAAKTNKLADAVGFIDFKRLDHALAARLVVNSPFRSQRNIGSCALEWAWLAAGRSTFIIHGGEKLWDYAAGALLASEAGCRISNFHGDSLFQKGQAASSVLAASTSTLHQQWVSILRES
ncbi:MAG: inositol monophosphatase family protein [Mariprofundaceae bacterium]